MASAPITIDATPPVLDNPNLPDLTGQCEIDEPTPPTATDAEDGQIVGTINTTLPITIQGPHVITWTFTDSAGNTTEQTQNAIVEDTEALAAPANFVIDTTTDTTVTVSSDISDDNRTVDHYEFFVDTSIDDDPNGTIVGTNTVSVRATTPLRFAATIPQFS